MSGRMDFAGRTAVITGAANGIGAALAGALSARGCHLALADINMAGLEAVRKSLPGEGRATLHAVDVSQPDAIAAFAKAVRDEHGGAHLLFNNAGVAVGGTFEEIAPEDFEWLFAINFWGVVRVTRAFLPLLREADAAHITNISSIFGVIAPAGQTAYSASKFGVRGFSDALRHELAGSPVGVTTVHPGGVATQIADSARIPAGASEKEIAARREQAKRLLTMPSPQAAEIILKAVEKRKPRVLVGRDAKLAALFERLSPGGYWSLINRRAERI
ncbi:SDR family NAD(P)-dependent oxidoreductase [Euryhalocaulis caribicus]|uniref:SDR family NAD(P)-dependent oxidoreductase n=1 Tax=Euryhalocaulis caribicus TaxID=1161401 RepID=UPI0003A38867|nr:SDR family NAD(P)-dependent oxidoreductase [Euryhalocaulis caribicus]